jgi:hypothetical protein
MKTGSLLRLVPRPDQPPAVGDAAAVAASRMRRRVVLASILGNGLE